MTVIEKLNYIWRNFSQEKIARELNVSFVTVNRWIHGKMTPHYRNRIRINELHSFCHLNRLQSTIEQKIYFALYFTE